MVSWGATTFKMASEEDILTKEMSIQLFSRWKVDQLKTFLKKKREVVLSGRKAELAEKAYYAWKLKLEVAKTTREEEDHVSTRRRRETLTSTAHLQQVCEVFLFPVFLFPTALKRMGRG